MNELVKIAERYHLPPEIIEEMMQSGGEEFACLDQKARLIGVRMILGNLFGKEEYFSLEDVCHVTGESKEDVLDLMKESGISPAKVSIAPWLRKENNE